MDFGSYFPVQKMLFSILFGLLLPDYLLCKEAARSTK